ncbi:hypothetical protein LguiB_011545 [Lonicera macranthoides]
MQPTGGGGGLARFRSAPASWLEALLESEEEELEDVVVDPPTPKPTATTPTHQLHNISPNPPKNPSAVVDPELLFGSTVGGGSSSSFLRQNSSPAEFLSQIDGYFSNFGIPPPPNYDHYLSPTLDVSGSSKRPRVIDSQNPSLKFPSQLQVKGEQSGELHGGVGGSLDAEMDKLLEDSVPCRIRAKRGCATHPRSVAERVRRTRISDRIRKLQELLPNMDKQTNTADMLEEAVDYVRFLQKQIQELEEHQKKCKCSDRD